MKVCPKCGIDNAPDFRYCGICGEFLDEGACTRGGCD